jgi:hypothetical protein
MAKNTRTLKQDIGGVSGAIGTFCIIFVLTASGALLLAKAIAWLFGG